MKVEDRLLARAGRLRRPPAEVVRHHLLEGVLRRVGRLASPVDFVLRGGMLARGWVGSRLRSAQDLDFVGTFSHDVEETAERFRPVLTDDVPDGVVIDAGSFRARGIWTDTDFPGVRLFLRLGLGVPDQNLSVDVGFGDPLIPPAQVFDYPSLLTGLPVRVWACRPETMVGWKLHGLAERGARWRPKDLHDLLLMTEHLPMNVADLAPAIEAAFVSRGFTVADAREVLHAPALWAPKQAQVRWEEFRGEVTSNLTEVVAVVAARLGPALEQLSDTSSGG
jgi:hypothetical protein